MLIGLAIDFVVVVVVMELVLFFDQNMYCFKIIFLILITYNTLGLKNSGIKCQLSYLLTDF